MAKMMLSTGRLSALLKPQGFWLRDSDSVTKTILFVRRSSIPRLYEHLIIQGQGKKGEAVYATTAVSGSTSHSSDDCISEEDLTLLYTLQADKERHWTLVCNKAEVEQWERQLVLHADLQCRATAQSKGPRLHDRLQPAFAAVDGYILRLGNVNAVFDSEFQYFANAPSNKRREAERLASLVGYIGESSENIQLACLVLFLFSSDVEGITFGGKKWHEDSCLRVRIYLLVDFLREKRQLYNASKF